MNALNTAALVGALFLRKRHMARLNQLLISSAPLTSDEVKIVIDFSEATSSVKINGLMQVGADTQLCGDAEVAPTQ